MEAGTGEQHQSGTKMDNKTFSSETLGERVREIMVTRMRLEKELQVWMDQVARPPQSSNLLHHQKMV
jgi:hypothetical protein